MCRSWKFAGVVGLICGGLCLLPQAAAVGQEAQPAPQTAPEALSPELEKVLQTWEQRSTDMGRVQGEFTRREYNKVFETVKFAAGHYWYEYPDKGRMDFLADRQIPAAPDNKIEAYGTTFTIEPAEANSWICNGKEILDVDLVNKTYNRVQIPVQFQGNNISDGPLPFLFGMKADKLKGRYVLSLGAMHNPAERIHLVAHPLHPTERREYQEANVLLNPETYLPTHIQLLDPTGNKITVYHFMKHEKKVIPWLPTAPWQQSMLGFRLLNDYKESPNAEMSEPTGEPKEASRSNGLFLR